MLSETTELRDKLEQNTKYFRSRLTEAGFDIRNGEHPIVPIMLYDAEVMMPFLKTNNSIICNFIMTTNT